MKRSRTETTPSRIPSSPPTKTQKGIKDLNPKGMGRARASAAEKAYKGNGGGKRAVAVPAVDPAAPPAPAVVEEVEMLGWEGEYYGWWWGVEEEMLLGWFPFVDEHFLWSENREGSGLFWEEEEEEDYDIWQLQQIHEIPNPTAK